MNLGWRFDAMLWLSDRLIFHGGLARLREDAIRLAAPRPGDAVLDAGCGTGGVAVAVKRLVGSGTVLGIDPGPRQVARARRRARRAGLAVHFEVGVIERIPAPPGSFDVAICTMVLHHLPEDVKRRGLQELARVLVPDGRLVVADFYRPAERDGKRRRFGAGDSGVQDLPEIAVDAGFRDIQAGDLGLRRFLSMPGAGYVTARAPARSRARSVRA